MGGNALSELGRKEEAIAALERSLEVDPRYALAHYDLGTVLQTGSAEEVDRALKCFETAIALDPDLFWAYYAAGCIHARAGRTAEALHLVEQALAKGMKDFEHIERDADLDPLRQDDRFAELMGRYQKG
ncbi:MAG: tetratricopeptide repeat protein [Thermoanaerobaculia bacterium]